MVAKESDPTDLSEVAGNLHDPGASSQTKNGADILATSDIDILGRKDHKVVGDGGGVGGDIGGKDGKAPHECGKELSGPVLH